MKTVVVVDKVGRLVLPKEIREAIGVFGRTPLTVEVIGNSAQITASHPAGAPLERRGKRTIFAGPLPENWNSGEAVLKMREQRTRR